MLIVGNWKAYVDTKEEAKKLLALAKRLSSASRRTRLVIAPPAPFIGMLASGNRSKLTFAGQDVSVATVGAATGEVTADALRGVGATHVIIGHSERRAKGETDDMVAEKLKRAFASRLTPILCIGETERDIDAKYLSRIREQIGTAYKDLNPRERLDIIIAYEPVWAIGRSAEEALPASDIAEMVLYIRKILGDYLPERGVAKTRILYGGSVDASNVRALATGSGVDGFLVGRASSEPESYSALVRALS